MEYIHIEDHVEFVVHKLKGRTAAWWDQFQNMCTYQGKPPIRTWRQMKRLLQARSFALEKEEMKNRPRPFMRFYQPNETSKPHHQPPVEEQSTK